jgi:hypothetical protein
MPNIASKRVNKNTGLNPIAQAVARENMRKAVLDQKIQLYMRAEGEPCVDFCVPISMMFRALLATAEIDPRVGTNIYEVRIIRGALSALEQMIADNSYRRVNIVSLELALDCAYTLTSKVSSALFNQEWNKVAGSM